jgi:hypothetical protein
VLLGWLQRKRFYIFRRRMQLQQKEEKERRSRLQRIRTQEKKFAFLRQLPMEGYLDFERMKLGDAARSYSLPLCLLSQTIFYSTESFRSHGRNNEIKRNGNLSLNKTQRGRLHKVGH